MSRRIFIAASMLLAVAVSADWAWAIPGRGGGLGGSIRGGGGGGGIRLGGGGGGSFRSGGGAALRSGGGIGGGMRVSPGIGSSLRSSPGIGSAIRSSPGTGAFRGTPNLGGGSALSRSLGAGGLNLARPGSTALRPLTNSAAGNRVLSSPRTLSPLGTGAARVGNAIGGLNLGGLAGQANLSSRGIVSSAASGRAGGALSAPFEGRVSRNQLGDFLSLSGRTGSITGGQLRGSQALNISRSGGQSNWGNLSLNQISRINSNVNVAFRNGATADLGRFNNGFGYGYGNHAHWNNWAGGVRGAWSPQGYHNNFSPHFWATNHVHFPWARSYYWWGARPWGYWWGRPAWGALARWILPPYGNWQTPYYYGYGPGGNVVYQNGYVYLNDQPIATVADYAASAAELATVPEPANPDQAVEWMPLGTFALSEGENDKNPSRVLQLAVDKDGNISGTMVNQSTKQTYPVQGRVDKETQRVAFTIGDNKDVVLETGIYNLTQEQTPVLAHGEGREETYLLLRLDPPKSDDAQAVTPDASGNRLIP